MQRAELHHQEVINSVTLATEHNRHNEVPQLRGEAIRTLQTQAREHEDAQERLRRESVLQSENIANCMSAKQTAESQQAQAAFAELQQRDLIKEGGFARLTQTLLASESARVASGSARVAS